MILFEVVNLNPEFTSSKYLIPIIEFDDSSQLIIQEISESH